MFCTHCGKENDEKNQFCLHCGAVLHAPSSDAKLVGKKPQKSTPTATKSRKLLIGFGVAIIGILALAVWGVVAIGTSLFSPKEQLIYVIQEDQHEGFSALMTIRSDGKNNSELYSDRDGFLIGGFLPGLSNIFSSDGKTIAFPDSEGNLVLLRVDGTAPQTLEDNVGFSTMLQGFSPNGDYFGYTALDNYENPVIHVIDRQANEILFVENMIFFAFLPNGNGAIAAEYDSDDYRLTTLGVIDISTGDYNYLAEFSEYFGAGFPCFSPDGKTIYYWDDADLMEVSSSGGSATAIYEAEYGGGDAWIFFSPNGQHMAILDGNAGELYLYEPNEGSKVRIDKDVVLDVEDFVGGDKEIMQFPASFSPDSKYLAYTVSDSYAELYTIRIDGSNRVRLAKDAQSFNFAFSPDKRRIAYIKFDAYNEGGDLYIARVDGSESKRLDSGVWSFRFVDGGKHIVYIKAADLDRGNPESEIYRIRLDGQKKERLLDADDGLYTFIWPLP
jgi:Tol biopolymer transport system component